MKRVLRVVYLVVLIIVLSGGTPSAPWSHRV